MFGEVLREARLRAGMTQEELAHEANIDRTYISYLENDKNTPTLEILLQLGKALNTPASKLVARVEQMLDD